MTRLFLLGIVYFQERPESVFIPARVIWPRHQGTTTCHTLNYGTVLVWNSINVTVEIIAYVERENMAKFPFFSLFHVE